MISIAMTRLSKGDALAIARLHAESIATGFLSTLGNNFLMRLYRDMARTPGSVVFVARNEEDSILGFVAGTIDTGKMYKRILLCRGWLYCIMLLPRASDPDVLKKIIETMLYSQVALYKKYLEHRHARPRGTSVHRGR